MAIAEERRKTTARTLYETVTSYIDDNKHSRDVAERWLCSVLEPSLSMISGVLNNRPRPIDLPAISSFQAAEIEKQIEAKRKEIQNLERDLKTVQKNAA